MEKQKTASKRDLPSSSRYLEIVESQSDERNSKCSKAIRSGRGLPSRDLSTRIGSRSIPRTKMSGLSPSEFVELTSRKSYSSYVSSCLTRERFFFSFRFFFLFLSLFFVLFFSYFFFYTPTEKIEKEEGKKNSRAVLRTCEFPTAVCPYPCITANV